MEGKENADQYKIWQTHGYMESSEPDKKKASLHSDLSYNIFLVMRGEGRGAEG